MGKRRDTLAEHVARAHSQPLFYYLASKLQSREDARDLLQEVLASLVRVKRSTVKNPLAYALKCATAAVAAHYEGRKVQLVSIDEVGSDQMEGLSEDALGAVEFGEDVLRVLRRLPRSVQRDVYIKRLIYETPFPEIAAELKISIKVAYNYYSNMNKLVLKMISEQGVQTK